MDCPECDHSIIEDDIVCPCCSIQLWNPKVVKSWNKMEIVIDRTQAP